MEPGLQSSNFRAAPPARGGAVVTFDLLIFDLDGTLIDSQADVGHALNRVLAEYDIPPIDAAVISKHVGYGIQPLMAEKLNERRHHRSSTGVLTIRHLLLRKLRAPNESLHRASIALMKTAHRKVILTNKSTKFIAPILATLGIAEHFEASYGRESFAKTKPDPLPILSILREHGVGGRPRTHDRDTETDIHAGTAANVATCQVTYGYGKPEFLPRSSRPSPVPPRPPSCCAHRAKACRISTWMSSPARVTSKKDGST